MKMPSFKRLYKQDYPQEFQGLIDRLSVPFNSGFESLFNLSNKQISLSDNIFCVIRDLSVSVDANGLPQGSVGVSLGTQQTVLGVQVIRAINQTNPAIYPTSAPFVSYTQGTGNITINHIAGLPANNNFSLRVVIYG